LPTRPINALTGEPYHGTNVPRLWSLMHDDMRYLTFRQALQLCGHVMKGEHGHMLVYWGSSRKEDENGAVESFRFMKTFAVFHISQCAGLQLRTPQITPTDPPPAMTEIYAALGVTVKHFGEMPRYFPGPDFIQLPDPGAFNSPDAYASTALHELIHWTMHPSRLNRIAELTQRFPNDAYAAEEFVAELGAAMMCATLGINCAPQFHASYLAKWRGLLEKHPQAIVTVSSRAQSAADFLLERIRPKAADNEHPSSTHRETSHEHERAARA
jgi:antirestriction protein ArdC